MKILIISDAWHPQVNGVVRTYENLKTHLEKNGHMVKVIGPRDFKRRIPMPGYKEIEITYAAYKPLKKLIEDHNPDSIHIATEGPLGWSARKYCLRHNIKFTTMYHSQFPEYISTRVAKIFPFLRKISFNFAKNLIKKFHAPSSALLVSTQSIAQQLKDWGIETDIYPFTFGIDHSIFYLKEGKALDHLPRPVALYVGRLATEKNIEAFLSMLWQGSKVVVGSGPDEDRLRKKHPDILFTGKVTGADLTNYYCASDVFVFPSRTDTFGIVIIEALACGLPVAAYNVSGPKDILTNSKLGILDDDLSTAAHMALKNGSPQDRHAHVMRNYTWDQTVIDFLNAQETTLNDSHKQAN